MGIIKRLFLNTMAKKPLKKVSRSLPPPENGDKFVRADSIVAVTGKNENVHVDAITLDTMPNGSKNGTVIALAGSPGSHLDFKYMLPIFIEKGYRFIGINYPGYGFTKGDDKFTETNKEKYNYVKKVMEARNVSPSEKVIFMGHSRGTKTALELAGTYNEESTKGVILINGVGIRKHRGILPFWPIALFSRLWETFPFARKQLINPLIHIIYGMLGLKTSSPEMSACCLRSIYTFDLPSQTKFVDLVNQRNIKLLQLGGGKDWLIEKDITIEFANLFNNMKFIESHKQDDDEEVIDKISTEFKNGAKGVSVFFEKEGHFLNKFRAVVIANAVDIIFKESEKQFKNKL
uniref:Serine aminopeptidase S33 domain-containing protein n=2 Tax=Strongyloides stercoralis TaxID=6248 RepID=A0AAF5D761_STRER